MALFPCPECGRQISDKADACPQCGYPVARFRQEAAAQETETFTAQAGVMTCNYAKSQSLFKLYAQLGSREVYTTFFGGMAERASVTVCSDTDELLSVPADAEISATGTVLTIEFSLPKDEAKALTQTAKKVVMTRTLSKGDPLLQPTDGTIPRCPHCGSTAVQLEKESFDLGGAIAGSLLFGHAGFVAGGLSGDEVQRVCINCGHRF